MSSVIDDHVKIKRIPFARTLIAPEAIDEVGKVLTSGWVTSGPQVVEFEKELAAKVGARFGIAVSSCTTALELSLRALGLPAGAKVLTSTMTFAGAVHAIVHAGLRPVFVDVDPDTMMPNAETTAAATRRAGGVDAMVVLHFAGYPAPVAELAEAAGLPLDRVIEDAAHAIGTAVGDRPVGSISAATCFSFYATKNLPIGEGGMVTTDSEEIADYVKRTRLHGMSRDAWKRYLPGVAAWSYEIRDAGLKANMTDVQAAIGRVQLPHFEEWQTRRREIVALYDKLLSPIDGVAPPARPAEGTHAWHLYVVRVRPELGIARDQFISELSERGIDCSVHFIPLHKQPYFQRLLGDEIGEFPNADALFEQIVSLPLYPLMADEDVVRVGVAVGAVAASAGSASGHPGSRRSHTLVAAHSPALPADEVLDLDAIGSDRHVALKES